MGMHLSTTLSLGIRSFTSVCEKLFLSPPIIDRENYCAIINKELFALYHYAAQEISARIKTRPSKDHEISFLLYWQIIHSARIDKMIENEDNQEDWFDLFFE